MKIAVLNASNPLTLHLESDVYVSYLHGRNSCFEGDKCIKQCRSWHNWAYALETELFVFGKDNFQGVFNYDAVIILVNRDIQAVIPLVKKLKLMGKKVGVSFHESVGDLISGSGVPNENLAGRWTGLYQLVQASDFYVNIFGQMQSFFKGWLGEDKVKFANHGAPTEFGKQFIVPFERRAYDVLIGTRTFQQRLPRNTFVSLGVANKFAKEGKKVLYVSEDGNLRDLFDKIGFNKIEVKVGPFSWEDWLRICANSKLCIHTDCSKNLAQIAFDCAMVDTNCVGSDCWNNIRLGTDDGGATNKLVEMINSELTYPELQREFTAPFEVFKRNIAPDVIKEELLGVFR